MKPKDVNDWAGSPSEIIGLELGYSVEGSWKKEECNCT